MMARKNGFSLLTATVNHHWWAHFCGTMVNDYLDNALMALDKTRNQWSGVTGLLSKDTHKSAVVRCCKGPLLIGERPQAHKNCSIRSKVLTEWRVKTKQS